MGTRDQQDRQTVEGEHQEQKALCLGTCAGKLSPGEHAPERRYHGSRLANGVGDGYTREVGGNEIEHHPDAPDYSPQNSQGVSRSRRAKETGKVNRLTG